MNMSKINLLDFLSTGDKIYSGGEVYDVTKSTKTEDKKIDNMSEGKNKMNSADKRIEEYKKWLNE